MIYTNNSTKHWYIKDGDENRNSINGTWLYVQQPTLIDNSTQLKIKDSTINIELV